MNENRTDVCFLIDRSGSMGNMVEAVINGFNNYVTDQKQGVGECYITMYQFDDKFETHRMAQNAKECPPLGPEGFIPRGSTALHDSIVRAINSFDGYIRGLPFHEKPSRIIFVIHTDGHENASIEYKNKFGQIANLISQKRDNENWQFLFFGANQDAIAAGEQFGISGSNSNNVQNTSASMGMMYKTLSDKTQVYRSSNAYKGTVVMSYSDDEKKSLDK